MFCLSESLHDITTTPKIMRLSLVNLMNENKNKSYGGLALDICDNPEK